ncbi:MAG: four helix bundle protein [Bacteroidales bacterium]|nr:four helix bundle protein [Bacteroidales bacterium]
MKKSDVLRDKSKAFALRIINLYKYLCEQKSEYVLSKQVLRSGTSIGANISEGGYAQSKSDFVSKLTIALKETAETEYWLELLHESEYIDNSSFQSISTDCSELLILLTSSIKTTKSNLK